MLLTRYSLLIVHILSLIKFLWGACVIRYYHNTPDHNIQETLSEEDLYTVPLKNSPRRLLMGYRQNWIPQRSSGRYDTMTSLSQPSGRPRTRSEMKPFTEAEFVDRRKCSRCGNISTRKPSTSRRNNCRFQDNRNFSTKGRFGKQAIFRKVQ